MRVIDKIVRGQGWVNMGILKKNTQDYQKKNTGFT